MQDMAALLATHPNRVDGSEMRQWFDERGIQYGPAFAGLAAAHTGDRTDGTVLAEVELPGADSLAADRLRRASRAAGCLLPVGRGSPARQGVSNAVACCCPWVCAGCAATARLATPATAIAG